jgi:predicted DNA-binding protein (UPF0251 family)
MRKPRNTKMSLSEKEQIQLGQEISKSMGTPKMSLTEAGERMGISKQAAAKLEYKAFAKIAMALRQLEVGVA